MSEKYSVSNFAIEKILGDIKAGEIAIPEIQRPFVWKPAQVRDLIDSLYTGYPTGYLIISQSPNMRLKDGTLSEGKKIMIDGQQRVTAMMTAINGFEIINSNFERKRIKIAFNPFAEGEEEERFKVLDSAIEKDKKWIADISEMFASGFSTHKYIKEFCKRNPGMSEEDEDRLESKLSQLLAVKTRQIGVITLDKNLTIDEVTEIFIRINSRGAKLNQADFAMSKIAANTTYGGNLLRKAIDYFSHLAAKPEWYADMCKDAEFVSSPYEPLMRWLKDDKDDIYDPDYGDILRVSFMFKFGKGKMKDLVSLLGGRDFDLRDYKEEIAEESFASLSEGVKCFMRKDAFCNFILAIRSAGFISNKLTNSQITLDFAYTLYLLLHDDPKIDKQLLKHYVARWYVMSTLTSRYITSPESMMDLDIRRIKEKGFLSYFEELEKAELSDAFWNVGLVQALETSAINGPYMNVYWAAQIHGNDFSMLTKKTTIRDLVSLIGDVHHIFPKAYLRKNGFDDKSKYNQIANYTYLDNVVNKAVGEKAPCDYFKAVFAQCDSSEKDLQYGDIANLNELKENLAMNCIPEGIENMDYNSYNEFLQKRRVLMAAKIKKYYLSL